MTPEELEEIFGKGSVLFTINTTSYVPSGKPESPISVPEISCSVNPESSSQIVPDPIQEK